MPSYIKLVLRNYLFLFYDVGVVAQQLYFFQEAKNQHIMLKNKSKIFMIRNF